MKLKSRLIGISGKKQSGKNETAKIILQEYPYFEKKAFADPLKKFLSSCFNVPVEKFEYEKFKSQIMPDKWQVVLPNKTLSKRTVRWYLTNTGTNALRNEVHTNFWVNALSSEFTKDSYWVISDVRYLNEAQWIKDNNGIIIRVERNKKYESSDGWHSSENSLDGYPDFDHVIHNDSNKQTLKKKVLLILNSYKNDNPPLNS